MNCNPQLGLRIWIVIFVRLFCNLLQWHSRQDTLSENLPKKIQESEIRGWRGDGFFVRIRIWPKIWWIASPTAWYYRRFNSKLSSQDFWNLRPLFLTRNKRILYSKLNFRVYVYLPSFSLN